MKRSFILYLIGILISPLLLSCAGKKEPYKSVDTGFLFNQSVELLNNITRQITFAKDSLSVDSLSDVFEKKIVEINFSVPAETDLNLTEQENDSLSKLYKKYLDTKSAKLLEFSKTENDSIQINDTIPINEEKENVD